MSALTRLPPGHRPRVREEVALPAPQPVVVKVAPAPQISICYMTSRRQPLWQWFADSLCRQVPADDLTRLQVVFVDSHVWMEPERYDVCAEEIALADPVNLRDERVDELRAVVAGRFKFLHVPPKPCVWHGPFRLTSKDWFCAGNQRNTAIVVARHPYLVFVDDLSCLAPTWWSQVRIAAEAGWTICGSYKKLKQMVVVNGELTSFEEYPAGVDSRWGHGSDRGPVGWRGEGMYGCSFGVPLDLALETDGNDFATFGCGAEDYDWGARLERAGGQFMYSRAMLTFESEEHHHIEPSLPRESRVVSKDRLPKNYEGRRDSDWVMLNRVRHEAHRIIPTIPEGLRAMRERFIETGRVPIPKQPSTDWRDGTPLNAL